MTEVAWNKIKHSKYFYIYTYRKLSLYIIFSVCLNFLLGLAIMYIYLNEPEHDFYSTSGIVPPLPLTPLMTPNYKGQYLLPPDSEVKEAAKIIPE